MKIVIAPDSFKGSLSAREAAVAIAEGIRAIVPNAELVLLPLADGGEGTVETLVAATQGRIVHHRVMGPIGRYVDASYGILGDKTTKVVEIASASGLTLVPSDQRDPRRTTSFGTGQLILRAISNVTTRLLIGLGGGATNDGGIGAMQALGVKFLDSHNRALPGSAAGGDLSRIARIDTEGLNPALTRIPVTIACDVTNPLTGSNGASAIYGPQKGATPEMVEELDEALARYGELIKRDLGVDVADRPGAGAAGGLGAAFLAFLRADMRSGIDMMLEAVAFDRHVANADWIMTGEGSIDEQTLSGKALSGILSRSRSVPVIAFAGHIDPGAREALATNGLTATYALSDLAESPEESMRNAKFLLAQAAAYAAKKNLSAQLR